MAKDNIFLPKTVTYKSKEGNKGRVVVEPCYPGYGITWGNALRRVLLTSLPGGAVTAVKIRGARYEFSSIDGVKEDVLEIILNLKKLRIKIYGEHKDPIKLELNAKGKKKVKAGDIEKSSDVEIANPDLVLANITDSKAKLEMEIFVEEGYGWQSSDDKHKRDLGIGVILTDSAYSPIKKVGIDVEDVRVGERTDYDRLTLDITTDGTLTPKQAFFRASDLLTQQFSFLNNFLQSDQNKKETTEEKTKKPVKKTKKPVKKTKKKTTKKKSTKKTKKKAKTKKKPAKKTKKKATKKTKKKSKKK
ncbi:MAG TPA: DNA-directed RNA polymerase subunit alpha [Patescibacteria group bacterium]|nr:DNA-directed RNA polymerase subunit alpha [Patescibacteria group bacterium]